MSDHHLTVLRDFGSYKTGELIKDDTEIARILGGEHRVHVVKVHADPTPEEPKPLQAPAPALATSLKADPARD